MAVIDLDDWQDSEILTDSERQEVQKLDRLVRRYSLWFTHTNYEEWPKSLNFFIKYLAKSIRSTDVFCSIPKLLEYQLGFCLLSGKRWKACDLKPTFWVWLDHFEGKNNSWSKWWKWLFALQNLETKIKLKISFPEKAVKCSNSQNWCFWYASVYFLLSRLPPTSLHMLENSKVKSSIESAWHWPNSTNVLLEDFLIYIRLLANWIRLYLFLMSAQHLLCICCKVLWERFCSSHFLFNFFFWRV